MPFQIIRQTRLIAVFAAGVLIGNAVLLWEVLATLQGIASHHG